MKHSIIISATALSVALLFPSLWEGPGMGFLLAQNIGINTTGATPNTKALLDIDGTTGGLLIPRMTTAQRNALAPAGTEESLLIYNTDTKCFEAYNATTSTWVGFGCIGCILPTAPTTGTHTPSTTQIVWNWNTSAGATGYKYNTVNNYGTATDNGASVTYTQTGLTCNTAYTLYVWAYNACGNSTATTLTQTTSVCCNPVWCSSFTNWQYRQKITITNNSGSETLPVDYTVFYTFNHAALVPAKSLSTGNDIRILYWNGSTCTELDRVLADGTSWNTTTTKIAFKTQASIPISGNSGDAYWMYYGYASAGIPLANANNVYLFYDDFSGYASCSDAAFTARWVRGYAQGTCSIVSATLQLVASSGSPNLGEGWYTQLVFPQDVVVQTKVNHNSGNRAGSVNYRYLSSDPTNYGSRPDLVFATASGNYWNYFGDIDVAGAAHGINIWYSHEARLRSGSWEHFIDGVAVVGEPTLNNYIRTGRIALTAWGDGVGANSESFDDITVRKYISPEPATGGGAEESCQ